MIVGVVCFAGEPRHRSWAGWHRRGRTPAAKAHAWSMRRLLCALLSHRYDGYHGQGLAACHEMRCDQQPCDHSHAKDARVKLKHPLYEQRNVKPNWPQKECATERPH